MASDLGRLGLRIDGTAGSVRLILRSRDGAAFDDDVVDLDANEAAAFASKMLVMAALSSAGPLSNIEMVANRIRDLLDGLDRAVDIIDDPRVLTPEERAASNELEVEEPENETAADDPPMEASNAPEVRAVRCADCGAIFLGAHGLAVHRGRAHREGRVTCGDCAATFDSQGGLDAHRVFAHGFPPRPFSLIDQVLGEANDVHRLADLRHTGDEHTAVCQCGFEGTGPSASDARGVLHDHVEAAAG